MKWRACRVEICFHRTFSSCVEYLLIFAKEKMLCGIKDQVRCRRFRELSGFYLGDWLWQSPETRVAASRHTAGFFRLPLPNVYPNNRL